MGIGEKIQLFILGVSLIGIAFLIVSPTPKKLEGQ